MANGQQIGFMVGEALAGGNGFKREQAFAAGQKSAADVQHISAQTQQALATANAKREEALKIQRQAEEDKKLGNNLFQLGAVDSPEQGEAAAGVIRGGFANFDNFGAGRLKIQERKNRDILGNPNALPGDQLAAAAGVKGEVQNPFMKTGDEYVDIRAPEKGVQVSPNTASEIANRNYRRDNPEKFRQTPKSVDEIRAEAEARALGTGNAKLALDFPQAQARFEAFSQKQDEIADRAKKLANEPGLGKAVGMFKSIAAIPGTEGATIRARLKTLVAKLTTQAVQEARDFSKTGGAYGNTNAREWEDIGQSAAALNENMEPSAFIEEALSLADRVELAKERSAKAFRLQYPNAAPAETSKPAAAAPKADKPKTVMQGGHTYTLNEATGEYE